MSSARFTLSKRFFQGSRELLFPPFLYMARSMWWQSPRWWPEDFDLKSPTRRNPEGGLLTTSQDTARSNGDTGAVILGAENGTSASHGYVPHFSGFFLGSMLNFINDAERPEREHHFSLLCPPCIRRASSFPRRNYSSATTIFRHGMTVSVFPTRELRLSEGCMVRQRLSGF